MEDDEQGWPLLWSWAADDKAAVTCHLASIEACLKTVGKLPVNIKMLVEGEEEIGSRHLIPFFEQYQKMIQADVIVVCDTSNVEVGTPCITYSLRGIVELLVEVEALKQPVHSGSGGGVLPDAAIALAEIFGPPVLARKRLPVPDSMKEYARSQPLRSWNTSCFPLPKRNSRKSSTCCPALI